MSIKLNKAIQAITIVGILSLSACGEEKITTHTDTDQPPSTSAPNKTSEQIKPVELNLSSSPINKEAFLGLIIPEVKQASPCPFLSDETALQIVKRNRNIKLRESSNEHCSWSKNLGFSIKLTIEPLTTAKPVKDRAYNLDNPPVLKPQSTPGTNAVVLYDTTWDKELAYALSFEKGNKLIMIYVTGMSTDAERLTQAAIEIASKLSSATIIEPQDVNASEFDMCSIWNKSDIKAIIGDPVTATKDKLDCKWEIGTGDNLKQIRIGIYYGKSYPFESLIKDGANEIADIGERSVMLRQGKNSATPSLVLLNSVYNEQLVSVSVTDTVDNHKEVALALAENIDKRLQ